MALGGPCHGSSEEGAEVGSGGRGCVKLVATHLSRVFCSCVQGRLGGHRGPWEYPKRVRTGEEEEASSG